MEVFIYILEKFIFRLGIREANWLLVEIAYIIKIINRNTNNLQMNILSFIYNCKRNTMCLESINLIIEKYGNFNAMHENERFNLFKVLDSEGSRLMSSGNSHSIGLPPF